MNTVYLAALMIGGSTLLGTFCGFLIHGISEAWNDAVTAFAAGVMLSAAMFGLFAPAMEMCASPILILTGTISGIFFLRIASKLAPRGLFCAHPELMFVLALAMHKFPEGMAGGVGIGGGSEGGSMVAAGVALQNIPEGAVMIPPLLAAGAGRGRAAMVAVSAGLLNALGVIAGGLWGRLSGGILPLALAFAGGAMLDVILRDMVPRIFASRALRGGGWILMGGFLTMIAVNMLF